MTVPIDLQWELIIIDNNSNDNTNDVVQDFIRSSGTQTRYFFEKNQGLAYARNRGILEASGQIIAFTDDDCIVDRLWILSIYREFLLDPSIICVCGRVELYNKDDKPVSIKTFNRRTTVSSRSDIFNLLMGANMSFVRKVFDEMGMFDTDFGTGAQLPATEDIDFFYRVYRRGLTIIYSPGTVVYHNHGRRSDAQIKSIRKVYAKGRGGFYCKYILTGDKGVFCQASKEILLRAKSIIKGILNGSPVDNHKIVLIAVVEGFLRKLLMTVRL